MRRWLRRVADVVSQEIGAAEVISAIGLVLLTAGLWRLSPAAALTVAGVILLWIGLPPRPTFIERSKPPEGR